MTLTIGAEQGTDLWHDQRRGIATASVVGALITEASPDPLGVPCPACEVETGPCLSIARKTPTLLKTVHGPRTDVAAALPPVIRPADNDTSRGLTMSLVAERITGVTEDNFVSNDMLRGLQCEPIARDLYSQHYAVADESGFISPVVESNFIRRDENGWTLGYSPDGLVGDDGLIEIKSPRAKGHLRTILDDRVPARYMAQCQAGLLVTGREWIDFVSFHGGLPLYVKRVLPDSDWFDALIAACCQFERTAAEMVAAYETAVAGLPPTDRVDFDLELVI